MKMNLQTIGFLVLGATVAASDVNAQLLPTKTRFIVPFAAGGTVDLSSRVLADKLRSQLNIPVIVDNRPSANGTIAAGFVKTSAPNGETLLYSASSMFTVAPHIEKSLPYDPFADFDPVSATCYVDIALVVGSAVPGNTLKEFINNARTARPALTMASSGVGSILHGYVEVLKDSTKLDLLHVPYKGSNPALTDLLGGQVSGMFNPYSLALPHIRAGKMKALAVVGSKRIAQAPDVPTFDELGYPGFPVSWHGVVAPKGMAPDMIKAWANAVARALEQDDSKEKLLAIGITTWVVPGDAFIRTMRSESERWKKLLADKASSS